MHDHTHDVLIVGGGLAGASLACALRDQPLRVGVIEAVPYDSSTQPSYDDRVLALSYGSRRIFEGIGLWDDMAKTATPIRQIHVSDRGHFGVTRLDCDAHRLDALGYVIEARRIGQSLQRLLASSNKLHLYCPAQVSSIQTADDHVTIEIKEADGTRTLQTRLLVAADGGQSIIRDSLRIKTRECEYNQTAIIANVTPELPHRYVAYERFTDSGPMALLPMRDNHCSLVWTVSPNRAAEIMALDDDQFLAQLTDRFGMRLGRFVRAGRRHAYPLKMLRASEQTHARTVLIGNAAHTLHPVAGQGFNLGLRDVATLAQVIVDAHRNHIDIGSAAALHEYTEWRDRDHDRVIGFTDTLVRLFSNSIPPVAAARNAGLALLDLLPPAKRLLGKQAMGLSGKQPRLARGLQL